MKKIIEVEPFNDIWYKDCLQNAILSVVHSICKRIDVYILDDFGGRYETKTIGNLTGIGLANEEISMQTKLERIGIRGYERKYEDQFTKIVENAIMENKLVISGVDCYYETLRPDTYHINHWMHMVLVNGFEDGIFHILESKFFDSVKYEHREIPYQVLDECCRSYSEWMKEQTDRHFLIYENRWKNLEREDINAKYENLNRGIMETFLQKKEQLFSSLNAISEFADKLAVDGSDEAFKALEEVAEGLNKIIHNLNVNSYIAKKFLNATEEEDEVFRELHSLWSGVRATLFKMAIGHRANDRYMNAVKDKMGKLKAAEEKRIQLQVKLVENYLKKGIEC